MEFEIKIIDKKEIWENFLKKIDEKTFLQSWEWGEFNKRMGEKIWRVGIYDKSLKLIALALVIKVSAKRGNFLLLPHGPLSIYDLKLDVLEVILQMLKEIAKKEGAHFIRICPICERSEKNSEVFKALGFREAPIHLHPEITWRLEITGSETEILSRMRKTTRYLIKRGQKLGVQIKKIPPKDLELFYDLYLETAKRHHFVPFSFDYIKNEVETFGENALILGGFFKGKLLASGIFIFWQKISFYHHGASLKELSNIPASYLLQWEAILEAKRRGCRRHDLWGVAEVKKIQNSPKERFEVENKKHPWAGLTLFKMGFGGKPKFYLKTQDYPISPFYILNLLIEKIRKKKRGF